MTAIFSLLLVILAGLSLASVIQIDSAFFIPLVPGSIAAISLVTVIISLFFAGRLSATPGKKAPSPELSGFANTSEIIINAIGDGVMAIDATGIISLINPAAEEILGWSKQDAVMLHYHSVMPLFDIEDHELNTGVDPVASVLNTNQEARASAVTAKTKSGKKITLSFVVTPIGQTGSGVIAVFRDVTKEKAEEREQAEFISTASHEMRTPVASIEGFLGLAMNPATATVDERAQSYITKAHEAAQHLGRLFQDLLDVSKSEDGRMTNFPRVVDMAAYTETIVEGLRQKATEKGLTLTYIPSSQRAQKTLVPVYYVNQDNDHIREVLDNLIENGIKYTPKGSVEVDISGNDENVIVSIKDSGLGIPREDIPHLFQKFYRINNADRQSIGGTGLGLYLSRRLAEAMQGRIWVESVYGQGSTFFLELPRITSDEAQRLKEQQAHQPLPPVLTLPDPEPVALASPAAAADITPPAGRTMEPVIRPASSVPRGESLTREQIMEKARQLEAMARSQTPPPRQ